MKTNNALLSEAVAAPKPVSKWIWPGILIALPASVIVASAITALFLIGRPDGLVASDYYKQGKAINAQLVKYERARALGMDTMVFEKTAAGLVARFPNAKSPSPVVEFVFAHPIDEAKDVKRVVAVSSDGVYVIPLARAFEERRRVFATDVPNRGWRAETLLNP
jgi:uncharacterized protein